MRSGFLHPTAYYLELETESQSLLNEVWFPTTDFATLLDIADLSQSLLNEVWFPTEKQVRRRIEDALSRNPF